MSNAVQRRIGLVVLLVLVVAGVVFLITLHPASGRPHAPVVGKAVRIPLEIERDVDDTVVTVPVTIGTRHFRFALDTGASTTAINGTVLRAIEAEDTGEDVELTDASGDTEDAHLFRLHRWSVGDVPLQRDALVANLARPLDVDGLLGSDQLGRFGRVTIDYDDQVLVVTPRAD